MREYEATNKDFVFTNVIIEGIKTVLNVFPDIIMDIILFVAVLMQIDKQFVTEFSQNL